MIEVDKLGVPVKVGDMVTYALTEQNMNVHIGYVSDIIEKTDRTGAVFSSYKIKSDRNSSIMRNYNQIINLQPIRTMHPEVFI